MHARMCQFSQNKMGENSSDFFFSFYFDGKKKKQLPSESIVQTHFVWTAPSHANIYFYSIAKASHKLIYYFLISAKHFGTAEMKYFCGLKIQQQIPVYEKTSVFIFPPLFS